MDIWGIYDISEVDFDVGDVTWFCRMDEIYGPCWRCTGMGV